MPYIVIEKQPKGGEMHVINSKGSLSFFGTPKKFMSKATAMEIAEMWAEINGNCGRDAPLVVRRVP